MPWAASTALKQSQVESDPPFRLNSLTSIKISTDLLLKWAWSSPWLMLRDPTAGIISGARGWRDETETDYSPHDQLLCWWTCRQQEEDDSLLFFCNLLDFVAQQKLNQASCTLNDAGTSVFDRHWHLTASANPNYVPGDEFKKAIHESILPSQMHNVNHTRFAKLMPSRGIPLSVFRGL